MSMSEIVITSVVLPIIILLWAGTATVLKMFWDAWWGE